MWKINSRVIKTIIIDFFVDFETYVLTLISRLSPNLQYTKNEVFN